MPTNVVKVEIREIHTGGEWYFVGIAGNGEIVVTSEMYTRKNDAGDAATAVFPGVAQWNAEPVSVEELQEGDD